MTQEIKIGSKVRIDKPTQKGWFWKYGWVAEIRGNEALINYGTQQHPIYGMGIWVKIEDLEVMRNKNMTVTVFEDSRRMSTTFDIRNLEYQKLTFTNVAIKIGLLRVRIMRLRNNLNSFDKALDDMHDCIMELEEVTKHE